jgi:hypothetical protein
MFQMWTQGMSNLNGNEFEESVQRIDDKSFDTDLFDQPGKVFKRRLREPGS